MRWISLFVRLAFRLWIPPPEATLNVLEQKCPSRRPATNEGGGKLEVASFWLRIDVAMAVFRPRAMRSAFACGGRLSTSVFHEESRCIPGSSSTIKTGF